MGNVIDFLLVYVGVELLVGTLFKEITPLSPWLLIWGYLIYGTLMDAYYGRTLGKKWAGLHLSLKGRSPMRSAFYRNFLKILLVMTGFDFLLLALTRGYSGFHNRIAKASITETQR
jgi:RDD family